MELWRLRRFAKGQERNVRRLLAGRPLRLPSLGSLTLDRDDVVLARSWLARPADWSDASPVVAFQEAFARWNGSVAAFAFTSCRVALAACIHALGIRAEDEVVLPGYTCVVVPNALRLAGVRPVFADIELETFGLDVATFEKRITPRTRAVLVHHLYGLVCRDYEELIALARKHGLKVIEDCAQSTGARYRGSRIGNLGDVAVYSSEQSKVFNTIQGGVATSNDPQVIARLAELHAGAPRPNAEWVGRLLNNVPLLYYVHKHKHRWLLEDLVEWRYGSDRLVSTTEEEERGGRPANAGCRMAAPVAALALRQLEKVDAYNARRRATAVAWDRWCDAHGYTRPRVVEGSEPVFLRYPFLVEPERKADISWAAEDPGVELGVWFRSHFHPAPGRPVGCPNADSAVARCVNLPGLTS